MRALITGITGQDGSYLAQQLLDDGHQVVGLIRPAEEHALPNIEPIRKQLTFCTGALDDADSLRAALAQAQPDWVFHLAAPSFVPESWRQPAETLTAIPVATATLLTEIQQKYPQTRIVVAASSAIFGDTDVSPQTETSRFQPTNPYAIAKLATLQITQAMRAHYGIHASAGILYNHESPRRPPQFVTRKITLGAAKIACGLEQELVLGDLDVVRDWSDARDVMAALQLMIEAPKPDDYIIASGQGHTVKDFVQTTFSLLDLDWQRYVRVDKRFVRPAEKHPAVGDPTKIQQGLGWQAKHTFEQLVETMVRADIDALRRDCAKSKRSF